MMTDKEIEQKALHLYPEYEYGFPMQENEHKREGYIQGARDMYEQMVKNAISCKVFWYDGPLLDYTREQQDEVLEKLGIVVGDSVKLIILKDNEEKI